MEQPVEDIELDPITARLLEFIRKKGPSKVAKVIGIKPSVFYNYEAGRNKQPAPDILQRIALSYPDFDLVYVMTGRSMLSVSTSSAVPDGRSDLLAVENAGLRKEIERLEKSNQFLQSVVSKQLGIDMESVKNESGTDTTLGKQLPIELTTYDKPARKMLTPSLRDAKGISGKWPNSGQSAHPGGTGQM